MHEFSPAQHPMPRSPHAAALTWVPWLLEQPAATANTAAGVASHRARLFLEGSLGSARAIVFARRSYRRRGAAVRRHPRVRVVRLSAGPHGFRVKKSNRKANRAIAVATGAEETRRASQGLRAWVRDDRSAVDERERRAARTGNRVRRPARPRSSRGPTRGAGLRARGRGTRRPASRRSSPE